MRIISAMEQILLDNMVSLQYVQGVSDITTSVKWKNYLIWRNGTYNRNCKWNNSSSWK